MMEVLREPCCAHRLPDGRCNGCKQQQGSQQRGAKQQTILLQVSQGNQDDQERRRDIAERDRNQETETQQQHDAADGAFRCLDQSESARMEDLLQAAQHRDDPMQKVDELSRADGAGSDARGEDRTGARHDHLERGHCEQHPGEHGYARKDAHQGQNQQDDAKRAVAQSAHQPIQRDGVCWRVTEQIMK